LAPSNAPLPRAPPATVNQRFSQGMSHFAAPQTSGVFTQYPDGAFCVQVDHNRHKRCSSTELYRLLTHVEPPPVLTQKGTVSKRQPPAHKDPPSHFYVAQLYHYGLPVVKTKAAAKKKLLDAFGDNKSLRVPAHVLDLKRDLQRRIEGVRAEAKKQEEDEKRPKQMARGRIERKTSTHKQLDASDFPAESTQKAGVSDVRKALASLSKDQLYQIVSNFVDTVPPIHRAVMKAAGLDASKKIENSNKVSSQLLHLN